MQPLEGKNTDEQVFIDELTKELRRSYKLSDFIYRKNFQYITGTDLEPLQSIDHIREWLWDQKDQLVYSNEEPEVLAAHCKLQIRLYAKNVFLVHAAYSQEETEIFISKLEEMQENREITKATQLLDWLIASLDALRQQYCLLLEKLVN